jgi:hypothetical protein
MFYTENSLFLSEEEGVDWDYSELMSISVEKRPEVTTCQ